MLHSLREPITATDHGSGQMQRFRSGPDRLIVGDMRFRAEFLWGINVRARPTMSDSLYRPVIPIASTNAPNSRVNNLFVSAQTSTA